MQIILLMQVMYKGKLCINGFLQLITLVSTHKGLFLQHRSKYIKLRLGQHRPLIAQYSCGAQLHFQLVVSQCYG